MNKDDPVAVGLDFEEFYVTQYTDVAGLAYSLSNNASVAEELTQRGFSAAYRKWDEVSVMDRPDAWVKRVVANMAASRIRRLIAETKAIFRLGASPDHVELTREDSMMVWSAIRKLPPRQGEAIVLTYYVGLQHAESAQMMGCSVETVRTHLKRAKTRLAELLGEP